MNETKALIQWDKIERQIDIERDLSILKKYHSVLASKELRKQLDGSIRGINKCERYKIKIEMAIGDYYKKVKDEKMSGLKQFPSSTNLTTEKQKAEADIDKSRETINKYVRKNHTKSKSQRA